MNAHGHITIGLLGCGIVGGGVADRILRGLSLDGARIDLGSALVRDLTKARAPAAVRPHLTNIAERVLDDPATDVVVECLGGVEPAATLVAAAMRRGLHVITANKSLLAARGAYLSALAAEHAVTLAFEAAVGGAMPVLRTVRHLAAADEIREVGGVLNGTTNFVLTALEDGRQLEDALREAQRAGYAEADPSADVDGVDAAHKLAILAAAAFGVWPACESIARRGIREISAGDVAFARSRGCRVKLVAWARRNGPASVVAAVGPTFVPDDHPFARPHGVENAALIVARHAGPITLGGPGAGRDATASAIVADLLDVLVSTSRTRTSNDTSAPIRLRKEISHA